jgi:hypothetical protein
MTINRLSSPVRMFWISRRPASTFSAVLSGTGSSVRMTSGAVRVKNDSTFTSLICFMAIPFAGSCRLKLQIKKPQAVSVFACGFKKWFI